jgi:hypothetical protein
MCTRCAIETIWPIVFVSAIGSRASGERTVAPRSTSISTASDG